MCSNGKIVIVGNKVHTSFDDLKDINLVNLPTDSETLSFSREFVSDISEIEKAIERISKNECIEKCKCKSINGFTKLNRRGRL